MTKAIIELDNISVTYPNGHSALSDVSVRLSTGIICGLIGVNGSGKSTLFKSMMGFITPTSGKVMINGEGVKKALRKNTVSYVPQTEDVDWNFPVLVEDVVMMGRYSHMGFLRIPSKKDKEAVDEALKRVDMIEYKTRQIGELSGGQKKRVFVARALAQGGDIILLDEPFTGIDTKTEESLITLFKLLSKEGRLIVVSTHNLGSVPSFCDEVILINNTILAYGTVENAFTEQNLSKAFGGMLRHQHIVAKDIHTDKDKRSVTVLTDDERPLVLYGDKKRQDIVKPEPE
ncbi:iron ABC transporter permease [Candidatus Marinamargulisbacteria bacterium SCGC AG-343-D04]|nr:iron ABC transporter permease [Candidatus Marinamargulisbacteria bacterium SCGC AG-343-D04]